MKLNGAQIVIDRLLAHGVTTVFGYPGGQVLPLYDELYKNADKIHHVLTAHEQGAAHAADGYARTSGKTAVVIATSGPGATNLVTGIANAYLDSVPLVAVTGNVAVPLLGRDSFQEVDIMGITQPIVKHNYVVRDVGALGDTLDEAFAIAGSGRRGPVLVDIPKDIQTDVCERCDAGSVVGGGDGTAHPRVSDVERIVSAIKNCKKPYIYAGGGVLASGAEAELRALSERLSAPVGFSMMGLSALPDDYALNLGMTGMHGKYAATVAKSECDVLIALGVRFSDRATGNVGEYREGKLIIHVDIDLAEIGKNVPSHMYVCGDVKEVLAKLLPALPAMRNGEWLSRVETLKKEDCQPETACFTPRNIIKTVRRFCDDETVVATDVGQHQMWVMQHYGFMKPRTLLTSGGLGAMGYGLGAAIGGCMANGKRKTVLFTGDGSFGMNLTELATAVSQELPVVIIILNNGVLGLPRQWQTVFFEERYSQSTLDRKTDFPALANAFGAEGRSAETLAQLEAAMQNLPGDKPVVIDCRIDMDEKVLPMIPPGGSVKDIIVN
ncbi:MAG: biosynthetic-type acetolactate synthase large subunit [Oscillospiraceae bacterium]|jgi:acetolactate synthase-1/2/3 large subunit|nr:biosynthetic-type acetolactate synthase large subunit [Oscillospiraceae bacterium]